MSKTDQNPDIRHALTPTRQTRGSTPVLPSAFLNDHASDEDSSRVLPFRAVQDRTILDAWIAGENYFFEWCVWVGFALYGLAFHGGWLALLGQGIILGSILGVTGIPPTENQALRSRGEAYRAYQRRVSKFIPLPPRT
jgi:hypothetical protein